MNPILEQICYGMIALCIVAIFFGLFCIQTAQHIDEHDNPVKKEDK